MTLLINHMPSTQSIAFRQIVEFRRSNRKFDPDTEIPDDVIRRGIENAILSPNSSNMQLWEFHWLKTDEWKVCTLVFGAKRGKNG